MVRSVLRETKRKNVFPAAENDFLGLNISGHWDGNIMRTGQTRLLLVEIGRV